MTFVSNKTYISQFRPTVKVVLDYPGGTYEGYIGNTRYNSLVGLDFTLKKIGEDETPSNCRIEVYDPSRELANRLFGYIDSVGGFSSNESRGSSSSSSPLVIGSGEWVIPTDGLVTSIYEDPSRSRHNGVDISNAPGKERGGSVIATKAGEVIVSSTLDGGNGNWVKIKHDGGYESLYLHLFDPSNLQVGDEVSQGQYIGDQGSTGNSTGTHLHFEIHKDGGPIDPALVMPPLGNKGSQVKRGTAFGSTDSFEGQVSTDGRFTISKDEAVSLIIQTARNEGIDDISHIANILGQVEHETNFIDAEEINGRSQAARLGYSGGTNYYGRGFIQITHDYNYQKFSNILGIDLIGNPQLATEPSIAAKIAVIGMRDGVFRGKKLSDYGSDGNYNHNAARRIVNGYVAAQASSVESKSLAWESYLRNGGELPSSNGSSTPTVSIEGSSGASSTAASYSGGDITINVFDDRQSHVFTYIHTGVVYNEAKRTTILIGQSRLKSFKSRVLQNTAYSNMTFKEVVKELVGEEDFDVDITEDNIQYYYFPVYNLTAYQALLKEADRRGFYVADDVRKDSPYTVKVIPAISEEVVEDKEQGQELVTPQDDSEDKTIPVEIYQIINGENASPDISFTYQAETQNLPSNSSERRANFKVDLDSGELSATEDAEEKDNVDTTVNESEAEQEDAPVYADEETEDTQDTVEEDDTVPSKAIKTKKSMVFMSRSDRTNSKNNPIWNILVLHKGEILESFEAVSGLATTQNLDRNIAGNLSPSPDGVYRIANQAGVPDGNPQLGGVFYPYYPTFNTQRSSLGFHTDPGWGAARDGTAGCTAFRTIGEYDAFISLIEKYNIREFVIEADGNPNNIGDTGTFRSGDAANRKAKSQEENGIKLTTKMPLDKPLMSLNALDKIITKGFGVDYDYTSVEGVDDFLDREWLVESINHSFYSNGMFSTINAISKFIK